MAFVSVFTAWDVVTLVAVALIIYKLWKRFTTPAPKSPVINTSTNKFQHLTFIDKIPTEYIQHTSDGDDTPLFSNTKSYDHILIVFPGNPGVVDIYDHLIDSMNEAFKSIDSWKDQTHCVVAVGFAGHTFNPSIRKHDSHTYSLKEQIDHKCNFIRKIHESHPNSRIYLAGHSVGALLCVKCLMLSRVPISKMFLLYPTIQNMHETSNAKFYGKFFRAGFRHIFASIAHVLNYVPTFLHDLVLKADKSSNESDLLRPFLSGFLNYQFVSNVIYLAMCEFAEIRDLSSEERAELNRRHTDMFFIFGRDDRWVPPAHVDEIHKMLHNHDDRTRKLHLHVDHEHGTRHAFVIYRKDVEIVTKFIASRIGS
jgi:pimeloyl-ACP methyl ester carboxylesterase